MNRILKSIATLAVTALALVSCQKEYESPSSQEGQEVAVSLDLTTPQIGTKAYADGQTVDVVRVHVYQQDAQGNLVYIAPNATTPTPSKDVTMTGGRATYATRLVTGQKYTFVFWAEKDGNGAYNYNPETKTVAVYYNTPAGNDESRDAFYAVLKDVEITGAYSASVQLHRPFAQLNFGASDYDAAVAAGITVTGAAVKVTGAANSLNLLDGSVSGSVDVEFENATLPTETLSAAGETYKYVAMDYVLVGKDAKTLSDVTLTLAATGTQSTTPEYTYTNVPLQGNYRTNIVGSLFTSPADITITVDPAFSTPDETIVTGVANLEGANTAFANGATEVVVEEITSSDPDEIILPATTSEVSLTLPAAPDGKSITIKYPDAASEVPATLNITAVNAESLIIEAPQTHVEVNGITVTSLTASTSNTTLVIGEDVTVTTLTIEAGSVEIYGNVGTLTNNGTGAVTVWAVGDKENFNKAYAAGAETIELKNDIKDFTEAILVKRSLTINGNGYEIWNTATRVMRFEETNGANLSLNNLGLISKCTASSDVRGISIWGNASSVIEFDNCTVSASFYAINFTSNNSALTVRIKNATVAGWAAINCYANNSTFTIENSTLRGLNDKLESSSNDFATIVFDGYGLSNASNIGVAGTGNTMNIVNSTVYASSESSNNQAWIALQYGAQRNMVTVDAATRIINNADNDQTSNVAICNYVGYNASAGTATFYDLESEIWVAEQNLFPGMYLKDGVYHIINAAGLVYFSDKVGKYSDEMAGKTVLLDNDIDMSGIEFTPIGYTISSYANDSFAGVFDGQGYTISNLKASSNVANYAAAGLFGTLTGTVKNVNLKDVEITSTHYAGGVVGYISNNSGANVQNCTVVGGTVTSMAEQIEGVYDNGDKVGGVVGYIAASDYISGCSVSNLTIKGYRDLGGIVGCTSGAVNILNCTVGENVNVVVDNTHNYKNYSENSSYNAGHIIGRDSSSNAVTTGSTGTATITYPYSN
ncbi:MAG: DUF6562 domain-containing protein [Candidatus Cryptobacteroides sp.]